MIDECLYRCLFYPKGPFRGVGRSVWGNAGRDAVSDFIQIKDFIALLKVMKE